MATRSGKKPRKNFIARAALVYAALLLCVAAASCASVATRKDDERRVQAGEVFQKAEAYYRNHFYARAVEAYNQVLEIDPKGAYADQALYKIAGIHMRQDQPEKAVLYFARLQSEFPRSPFAQEALYNMGYCYFKMGDPARALEAYKDYLALGEARNKSRARVLAAESLEALGKYGEALGYYAVAGAAEQDRDKQVEILQGVKKLVEDRLTPAGLEEIAPKLPSGVVSDYVYFRLAQDALSAGEPDLARKKIASIDFRRAKFQFYKDAQALLDSLGLETGKKPTVTVLTEPPKPLPLLTIGVVLPLSGKFGVYGEQALHGIMLGVDRQGEKDIGLKIEVLVRDSEADPETAAKRVEELAADERVRAVIGPLLVKESEPAADAADRLQVPIIALSRKEGLARDRVWVFRNAVTFTHQARALIQYASTHLSVRRFAVMYPETEFGEAFRTAFEKAIDPSKQTVSVVTSYPADATDFRRQANAILQAGGVEAVFIPDAADRVALIAPQLVYFGVTNVELLGPSSWNDDSLAQKAGPYLKRAVIVDGFFADAHDPRVQDFAGKYENQFGERPTLLSALGYDAVGLIGRVAKSGSADTRGALRRGLLEIRDYPGVTGRTTFYENGEVEKTLYLLQVGTDRIEVRY